MKKITLSLLTVVLVVLLGNLSFGQITLSRSFYFPQIADGISGGDAIRTQVIIINPNNSTAQLRVAVFDNDGSPMSLTFTDRQTGNSITDSRFNYTLPAWQMVILETPGTQSGYRTGWLWVVSNDVPISGTSAFSFYNRDGLLRTTVGVGASTSLVSLASPVVYNRNQGLSTGLALVNITNRSDDLDVSLVDALTGQTVERKTLRMTAGTHIARFVDELFDTIRGSNRFEGTMYFTTHNSEISAVTLFFNGDKWSSFPVVQLQGGTLKQSPAGSPAPYELYQESMPFDNDLRTLKGRE
jgi:hypothetical protein